MSTLFRRTMHYLGLGPDEDYEAYAAGEEAAPEPQAPASRPQAVPDRPAPEHQAAPAEDDVVVLNEAPRTVAEPEPEPEAEPAVSAVRPLDVETVEPPDAGESAGGTVRPIPVANAKPQVVAPTSFNAAQEVADRFRSAQPVIVNLQGSDRDLARRVIDFASGLCYGLGGQMERVAKDVYLLTPSDVEVSDEDRRQFSSRPR